MFRFILMKITSRFNDFIGNSASQNSSKAVAMYTLMWCTLTNMTTGHTRMIDIPSCFGILDSWTNANFFYLTFSSFNPAFTLRTPDHGIPLSAYQSKRAGTCAIAVQVPANKALETISVYLNKANIDPVVAHTNTRLKLSFFYHNLKSNFEPLLDLILTAENRADENVQIPRWPGPTNTIYISVGPDVEDIDVLVHLSITITPVYRCLYEEYTSRKAMVAVRRNSQWEYALKFHTDYLLCIKQTEQPPSPIGLCIARTLRCDGQNNCPPTKELPMSYADEPKDRTMCVSPKRIRSYNWKIVYGICAAFFSLCMVFTLIFLSTEKKSVCCKRIWLWLQKRRRLSDTWSTPTDSDLPMAPPRYQSVETMPPSKNAICALCSKSPKPVYYYESPPSYTRDAVDETGVSPTFIRRFYNRHKRRRRLLDVRGQNTVSPLLNNHTIAVSDVQTEEVRSLESWEDVYDQIEVGHAAESPTNQNVLIENANRNEEEPPYTPSNA
ncbi:unnamed protein product [Dicrocoelium dendriticum]|nr:unnamed protein product [Dicrocoelium dendriticum]